MTTRRDAIAAPRAAHPEDAEVEPATVAVAAKVATEQEFTDPLITLQGLKHQTTTDRMLPAVTDATNGEAITGALHVEVEPRTTVVAAQKARREHTDPLISLPETDLVTATEQRVRAATDPSELPSTDPLVTLDDLGTATKQIVPVVRAVRAPRIHVPTEEAEPATTLYEAVKPRRKRKRSRKSPKPEPASHALRNALIVGGAAALAAAAVWLAMSGSREPPPAATPMVAATGGPRVTSREVPTVAVVDAPRASLAPPPAAPVATASATAAQAPTTQPAATADGKRVRPLPSARASAHVDAPATSAGAELPSLPKSPYP